MRVTECLFDRFGAQTQKRKRVTNNWTNGKKSRSTVWRREHANKIEAKRLQQVAASYGPTLHALQAVLVSPATVMKEAKRLKYPSTKLHTMLIATRFAVRRILEGNSKSYSYEQAAEAIEVPFSSVSRWLRSFRSSRYTLHRTGQQVACKNNLFPPSQQLGHLPEGLCTPEVREQCRQFVYANAVNGIDKRTAWKFVRKARALRDGASGLNMDGRVRVIAKSRINPGKHASVLTLGLHHLNMKRNRQRHNKLLKHNKHTTNE